MSTKQKRYFLTEEEIPTQWYNIQADMTTKPMPPLNPSTKEPLTVDDLAQIFPRECCVQELDTENAWIDIPEDVLNTIATAVGEEAGTIEEVYEPFLIQEGYLMRTPRGREATEFAYRHLGRTRGAVNGELELF